MPDLKEIIQACEGPVHLSLSKDLAVTFGEGRADAEMVSVIRLEQDGTTPRSKRVELCPPIIVDSHGVGLRLLAILFDEIDRG